MESNISYGGAILLGVSDLIDFDFHHEEVVIGDSLPVLGGGMKLRARWVEMDGSRIHYIRGGEGEWIVFRMACGND